LGSILIQPRTDTLEIGLRNNQDFNNYGLLIITSAETSGVINEGLFKNQLSGMIQVDSTPSGISNRGQFENYGLIDVRDSKENGIGIGLNEMGSVFENHGSIKLNRLRGGGIWFNVSNCQFINHNNGSIVMKEFELIDSEAISFNFDGNLFDNFGQISIDECAVGIHLGGGVFNNSDTLEIVNSNVAGLLHQSNCTLNNMFSGHILIDPAQGSSYDGSGATNNVFQCDGTIEFN